MDIDALPDSTMSSRRASLSPRRLVVLLVSVAAVVVLVIASYAPLARWWTRSQGEHLTLAEVQGRVRLDLPEAGSDIRFYQHLHPDEVVVVDFAISEDAFLEWAVQQGWKPEPIVGGVTVWPRAAFGDRATEVAVTDGYQYHNLRRGIPNTFSITFDRGSGRAYYEFCSEPRNGEG